MRGTSPIATRSQPRVMGVTPVRARLRHAIHRRKRLRSAKAIPNPLIHSEVVPIQPCGGGTPSSAAQSATGRRREMTAATAAQGLNALLGAGVGLQPARVDVLGFGLVLVWPLPLGAGAECHAIAGL